MFYERSGVFKGRGFSESLLSPRSTSSNTRHQLSFFISTTNAEPAKKFSPEKKFSFGALGFSCQRHITQPVHCLTDNSKLFATVLWEATRLNMGA